MDPWIEPLLRRLRDTRRDTLDLVANLSQDELDAKPGPQAWSVGEILDHLLKADEVYRADLAELFRRLDEGRRPEIHRSLSEFNIGLRWIPEPLTPLLAIPFGVFNLIAPAPLKQLVARVPIVSARNADRTSPEAGRPGDLLRAELAASIEDTTAFFEGRPSLPGERMRVTYPLIGTKSLPELLTFVADHEVRHQGQIRAAVGESARWPDERARPRHGR